MLVDNSNSSRLQLLRLHSSWSSRQRMHRHRRWNSNNNLSNRHSNKQLLMHRL